MIWFHHAIPFERIQYGEIIGCKEKSDDDFYLPAFEWLSGEVGFWPIFLAVGKPSDVYMTGYQNNWRRFLGHRAIYPKTGKMYFRKVYAKPMQNIVLFSFRHVEGVYTDYDAWHFALGAYGNRPQRELTKQEHQQIFKKSWSQSRWHKLAEKQSYVQLVTGKLDLRTAYRVWVRNKATKKALEKMGFKNVKIKRIPVG